MTSTFWGGTGLAKGVGVGAGSERGPLPVNVPELPTLTLGVLTSVLRTTMNPPFAMVKRAVPPELLVAVQPMKIPAPVQPLLQALVFARRPTLEPAQVAAQPPPGWVPVLDAPGLKNSNSPAGRGSIRWQKRPTRLSFRRRMLDQIGSLLSSHFSMHIIFGT